jgi:hypothetical protein
MARAGQKRENSEKRTKTEQENTTGRTGRQNGQAEQDRQNWIGRKEQALQSGRIG